MSRKSKYSFDQKKWAGEMRKEAMKGNIKNCPIVPNHRIEKYWKEIQKKKIREVKKSSAD